MLARFTPIPLAIVLLAGTQAESQEKDLLHVGIVDSLVKELSPGRRKLMTTEFPDLVRDFTTLKSDIIQGGAPLEAGTLLSSGKWHLGVFQGIEFAWAHANDAKIRPLMLAINRERAAHAVLVAKKDGNVSSFADLKGQEVHILSGREHCRLFADKHAGGDAAKFFGKVLPTGNSEAALDAILLDKVKGAVVDAAALQHYEDIQPGRFRRLKVVAKSEPFPPMVIAHSQDSLDDQTLEKFRSGMLKANQTERGREAMGNMNITGFEPVTDADLALIRDIVKAYPPPKK